MTSFGTHELTEQVRVSDDILGFLDAMTNGDYMDARDVLLFLEKPWKWADEYVLWLNNGKPLDHDEDAYQAWVDLMEDR